MSLPSTSTPRALGLGLLALAAACADGVSERGLPTGPALKPGGPSTAYTVVLPGALAGWTPMTLTGVNATHQVSGSVRLASDPSVFTARAARWDGTPGELPDLLPMPAGGLASSASSLNGSGVLGGAVDDRAVLWQPDGAGWTITILDDHGAVYGVGDAGDAVGIRFDEARMHPWPMLWPVAGGAIALPMPSPEFTGGMAHAINAQGDIAGTVRRPRPGGADEYGAVWLRDGASWLPVVLGGGPSRGVSDRTATGELVAISTSLRTAWRHRLVPGPTGWVHDSLALPGTAVGMNARGDLVGTIVRTRFGAEGQPYVLTREGREERLPLPKGTSGTATAIGRDGWILGTIGDLSVAWRP